MDVGFLVLSFLFFLGFTLQRETSQRLRQVTSGKRDFLREKDTNGEGNRNPLYPRQPPTAPRSPTQVSLLPQPSFSISSAHT